MGDLGPAKKVTLDKNIKYNLQQFLETVKEAYWTLYNKTIFEGCAVQLADPTTDKDVGVVEFLDKNGKQCDFWTYVDLFFPRDQAHRNKIVLLSTKKSRGTTTALQDRDPNSQGLNDNVLPVSSTKRSSDDAFGHSETNLAHLRKIAKTSAVVTSRMKNQVSSQKVQGSSDSSGNRGKNAHLPAKENHETSLSRESQNLVIFEETKERVQLSEQESSRSDQENLKRLRKESRNSSVVNNSFKIPNLPAPTKHRNYRYSNKDGTSTSQSCQKSEVLHDGNLKKMEGTHICEQPFSMRHLTLEGRIAYLKSLNLKIPLIDFDDLEEIEDIGAGGQASVSKYKWKGAFYAVKSYNLHDNELNIVREIAGLAQTSHPNIIRIMGICLSPKHYHIMTGLADGKNLDDLLQRTDKLDIKTKDSIGEQVTSAIVYLHLDLPDKPPIIHRDLKPANIVVSALGKVKLVDFGLCKFDGLPDKLTSGTDIIAGTVLYLSPQQLLQGKKATLKSDIWSLGCTLVEMYSEEDVWEVNYRFSLNDQVKKEMKSKRMPSLIDLPSYLLKPVERCFDWEESRRPDAELILKAYQDRFIFN